jgi:sulfatase modifying factor 1
VRNPDQIEVFMRLADATSSSARRQQHADMLVVPGGTFRMGSDKHYPEEAPVHRVTVDGFRMDRTPVTNRQFREFVEATGYVTFAEIAPDPKDYPGALPHMLRAGRERAMSTDTSQENNQKKQRAARHRDLAKGG